MAKAVISIKLSDYRLGADYAFSTKKPLLKSGCTEAFKAQPIFPVFEM